MQRFGIDLRRRRHSICGFLRGVAGFLSSLSREVFGVVGSPALLVLQVAFPRRVKVFITDEFAALEALPGAVRVCLGDAPVDETGGDVVGGFVVEDGLEGGDDL